MTRYGLLEGLTEQQRTEIEALLRPVRLVAGETVVREGEHGDALYLIEEGQLEVVKGHGEYRLTRLGPGDDFGSLPCWATSRARRPCGRSVRRGCWLSRSKTYARSPTRSQTAPIWSCSGIS